MFKDNTEALTEALVLAVTAPTQRQHYRALTTAEYLASKMSDDDIEEAKDNRRGTTQSRNQLVRTNKGDRNMNNNNIEPATVWVLTIHHGWDAETDTHSYEKQSVHVSKEVAMLRVFDFVYETAGLAPEETLVVCHAVRSDGGEAADLDTGDDEISFAVTPHVIDHRQEVAV